MYLKLNILYAIKIAPSYRHIISSVCCNTARFVTQARSCYHHGSCSISVATWFDGGGGGGLQPPEPLGFLCQCVVNYNTYLLHINVEISQLLLWTWNDEIKVLFFDTFSNLSSLPREVVKDGNLLSFHYTSINITSIPTHHSVTSW